MATETRDPLLEILSHLKVSVAQLRLYPKDSPQVLSVATQAYQSLNSWLTRHGTITLSRTPRGLLVNGKRLSSSGPTADTLETSTLQLLEEVRIKSVTFRKGLTLEELITFMHALSMKFWDIKEGKAINDRLRNERVLRIKVDEVEYVAVSDKDLIIEDAASKLEGGKSEVGRIMRTLDTVLDAATDDDLGSEVRLQIMKKLLDQEPGLIQRSQGKGDPEDGAGRITFEDARVALGEVIRAMRDADPRLRERLKRISHVLIGGFRHDEMILNLMKKFLEEQASELIPAWMDEEEEETAESASAIDRANSLLSREEDEMVQALAQEGPVLLKELAALGNKDMIEDIATALAGFVRDKLAPRRVAACTAFLAMMPVIRANTSIDFRDLLLRRVRFGLKSEKDPASYPKMSALAAELVEHELGQGRYEEATKILEVLRGQYQLKAPGFPGRVEQAFQALERIAAGSGIPPVMEKLRAGSGDAEIVMEMLDAAGTLYLIRGIKASGTSAERLRLAGLIRKAGSSAAAVMIEEVNKDLPPEEAERLADALPHAVADNMAEMGLSKFLHGRHASARCKAASVLADRNYPRSGVLLTDRLGTETEPRPRAAIVEALGRLRHETALDDVSRIAGSKNETDEVRAAACSALAQIGSEDAVPVLCRLSLRKRIGTAPPGVRSAATRALATFWADPKALETLRAAQKDPDPGVKSAADEALLQQSATVTSTSDLRNQSGAVAGDLSEVPFEGICRHISDSKKTGLLLLSFVGESGQVFFEKGLVVSADLGRTRDRDAFQEMVHRRSGRFLFQPDHTAPKRRMSAPVAELL